MRKIYLFILLLSGINILGQAIEKPEYIEITKAVLSNKEIRENLIKYSSFDFHSIFDKNQVFILDTNFIDEEVIFNDNNPKFVITDLFDIRIGSVNYWLTPINIIKKNNKIQYHFKTQSEHRQDSINYIHGTVHLKHVNGIWEANSACIKSYEFATQKELEIHEKDLECHGTIINCKSNYKRPRKTKTKNTFFGDWQLINDSIYLEYFFTDDSIFEYNELFGSSSFLNTKYKIVDDSFIVYYESFDSIVRKFEIIDKNKIRIFGEYSFVDYTDTVFVNDDFVINRIEKTEFRYSDVKCWGELSKNYPCFIKSHDWEEYYLGFMNRMDKFKKQK